MKIPKPIVRAFTVVELMVVVVVVGLLIAALSSALDNARRKATRMACVYNVKTVGYAFGTWQRDYGGFPMLYRTNNFDGPSFANDKQMFIYFQVLSNELVSPYRVTCPVDRARTAATNYDTDFNSSHVSYFVALDAEGNKPNSFLIGDRNITVNGTTPRNGVLEITTNQVPAGAPPSVTWTKEMHNQCGNILFADSHVGQLNNARLCDALRTSGLATNRLVLP